MSVTVKPFDKLRDGRTANLYTIENQKGMQVVLTDFGAILVKLLVPDREGKLRDVVLVMTSWKSTRIISICSERQWVAM